MASAIIAFVASRAFVEYLRRLAYDGPLRLWRELVLGSLAITAGSWASMVIDVSAQGLSFELGFHPFKIFGSLAVVLVLVVAVVGGMAYRLRWYTQVAAAVSLAVLLLVVQVAVLWSIGAEPGLTWRREPLVFAPLLTLTGLVVAGRMVIGARRGSRNDRPTRRLLAAMVLGAFLVAAQELVLTASGLDRQLVSAHARFLPEAAIALVAGAMVPVALVLMLLDQRAQKHARAAERARRRLATGHSGPDGESLLTESVLASHPAEPPAAPPR